MRSALLMLRSDIYFKLQEPEMAKKTFNFAHLMGFGKSASEEDEDKKAKKAKARKAEEDERDEDAEDEELPEPHAAMPRHMPAAHSAVTRLAAA